VASWLSTPSSLSLIDDASVDHFVKHPSPIKDAFNRYYLSCPFGSTFPLPLLFTACTLQAGEHEEWSKTKMVSAQVNKDIKM
tara:strand:- start:818 stop:1063 length:246 start_codon:yes stop_codon:yes gene_type:complete